MYVYATDRNDRFIGIRDAATGRFVPDTYLPLCDTDRELPDDYTPAAPTLAEMIAQLDELTLSARNRNRRITSADCIDRDEMSRRGGAHMVARDGERVSKKSKLDAPYDVRTSDPTLYSNERSIRRHTKGNGRMMAASAANRLGAVTASSTRMGDKARKRAATNRAGRMTVSFLPGFEPA